MPEEKRLSDKEKFKLKKLMKELGKDARKSVVEQYSWKSFAIKLDRLLKQVIGKYE